MKNKKTNKRKEKEFRSIQEFRRYYYPNTDDAAEQLSPADFGTKLANEVIANFRKALQAR
jgi:hypothetical protein